MTATAILIPVKPCIKCGACERYEGGACKVCARAASAARYAANPDKINAESKLWQAANADKVRAYKAKSNKSYRDANPEKVRASQSAWAKANPEKKRVNAAKVRASNPEKYKLKSVAWQNANPEKKKAMDSAWRLANPEARRIYSQNRRARKKLAGGTLSKGLLEKLLILQRGKCACCGLPLGISFHMDHITPLFLGGANADVNIQLLRSICNRKKGAKDPIDFMQSMGKLL